MKSSNRTPSNLPHSVIQRLDAYAAAAAAAVTGDIRASHPHWPYLLGGLGLVGLGLGVPSEAKIVYTPANHVIQTSQNKTVTYPVDLNHDGNNDVVFNQFCGGFEVHSVGCVLGASAGSSNGIEIGTGGHGWARAMKIGAHIGHAKPFRPAAMMACRWKFGTSQRGTSGYWWNSEPRYLGVAFKITGKTHYGWVRLRDSSDHGATVTGYAYETIPGRSIKAGHKKSSEGPGFEEPNTSVGHSIPRECTGSLGAMAMGAAGRSIGQR